MAFSFNNIGAVATQDGSGNVTPGAPTIAAKQLLVIVSGAFSGTLTLATPAGWADIHSGTGVTNSLHLFGRVSQAASEAMPVLAWGGGAVAWGICAVFDNPDLIDNTSIIVDAQSNDRAGTNSNIVGTASPRTPAQNGSLVLFGGSKNKSATSNGATISATDANFTQDYGAVATGGTQTARTLQHWIQTTSTSTSGGATISIADSATFRAILTILSPPPASTNIPTGQQELPVQHLRAKPRDVHQFWQVPIEISIIPPPSLPQADFDYPAFILRPRSNVQLGIEQGIPRPLVNTDRVLTPIDWGYAWDPAQLPVSLRSDSRGLNANDLSALTTFPPYTEYNWPVPLGPRQWNRGFEAQVNLNLIGKDRLLTTGPNNVQWDPPPGRRFPISLRGMEQSGLALANTVPLKPPLSEANWPVPPAPRRFVSDFVQGMPETIIRLLTTSPPFQPSSDLPPKRARSPVLEGSYSVAALLKGQDILPFGTQWIESLPRLRSNPSLFSIEETSSFLVPVPSPPSGPGARHMGRFILESVRANETSIVGMDFISGLAPGEFLDAGAAFVSLYSGTDSNPQAIVTGSMSFNGASIAQQSMHPLIVGNIYTVQYAVSTNLGSVLSGWGYLAIEPSLP